MLNFSAWQVLECWDSLISFDILPSQVGFSFFLVFSTCLVAFLHLVFKTTTLLEALFWAELLLVSTIVGLSSVAVLIQAPVGFVYCFFLLNATAVEAAVGMSIIVRLLHLGQSVSLYALRNVY